MSPLVTNITFSHAPPSAQASGLLGWVRFQVGMFQFDSVTLRRTADGRLALSFPTRRDSRGVDHCFAHPVDAEARRAIELAVISALSGDGGLVA
ncbi:MAG: hypothetical protein IT459_08040 [Planctomycetes bacterium]|nr:hypothetical protein [Planctomycetota bacterium]